MKNNGAKLMSALRTLTLAQARDGLRNGDFTAVSLTNAYLKAIKAGNDNRTPDKAAPEHTPPNETETNHTTDQTASERMNAYKAGLALKKGEIPPPRRPYNNGICCHSRPEQHYIFIQQRKSCRRLRLCRLHKNNKRRKN